MGIDGQIHQQITQFFVQHVNHLVENLAQG